MYNTSIQYIFNSHLLQNTSPTYGTRNFLRFLYKKFPKIFDKKCFFTKHVLHLLFYFPKNIPKNFLKTFYIFFTSSFSMFETCSCQRFLLSILLLLLYSSLLFKMNSHFNLDFSKLLHFWFTNPPMLVHNSLLHHALIQLEKDFHAV